VNHRFSKDRDIRFDEMIEFTGMVDLEIAEEAILIVSDILSEIVAPGTFAVIDAFSETHLGMNFVRAVEKNPKEAYNVLLTVLRNEVFLELIEKVIRRELRSRYSIRAPQGILLKLKEGDNSAFMQMMSSIYDKLRTEKML